MKSLIDKLKPVLIYRDSQKKPVFFGGVSREILKT